MSSVTTTPSTAPTSLFDRLGKMFRVNLQTYALIGALIVIWILFALANKSFIGPQNFSNLIRQMTVTALLSVGMVLVIVTGNIDLSVGKMAGFVSVAVAYYQAKTWPGFLPDMYAWFQTNLGITILIDQDVLAMILSVLFGLLIGLLMGVIQGYIIAFLRVPAFIMTLGTSWVLNGMILRQTEGRTIPADQPAFSQIAQGYLSPTVGWILAALVVALLFFTMARGRLKKRKYGFELAPLYLDVLKNVLFSALVVGYVAMVNQYNGVQAPVLLLAVIAVTVSYMSDNTRFGRYAYAIGGNREAARLSGVNIRNNIFMVFVLMGFLCGVSGIALASYVGYGTIGAGQGYELDAIAACILGGTSTLGGEGTIFGAMVGALIMASLSNGLQIMNVEPAWQYVVKGLVLVFAVFVDVQLKKNR